MSDFAQKTYKELMELVKEDEAFFFKDFPLQDKLYRIFDYYLASWTSFQKPGALNCRGITFEVSNPNNIALVSLPPAKFFNYEEGGVDHTKGKFGDKMVKMDGSLISTYMHDGQMYLKSKGSLFSKQAIDAMNLLNKNQRFKEELEKLVSLGYTVNLEYTSPENRIVIPYQEEKLTVLCARNHSNGQNYFATKLKSLLDEKKLNAIKEHMVKHESLHQQKIEHSSFVDSIRKEQEGEGYVVEIVLNEQESYLTKLKNIRYITLHHSKDNVNSNKRLFEAIIEQATDDLRAMFADDEYVLNKIAEMEKIVQPIYNNMIKTVNKFHQDNKHLERKDYALKAKKAHPKFVGFIMNLYLNRENDYKEYAKKYRKEIFGIDDDTPEINDEKVVLSKSAKP